MGWQTTLLQLSPLILDLAKIAEKAFEHRPKSGAEKKQFVHQAAKDILAGAGQVTTCGVHDTFEVVDKIAPPLIDTIAGFLFSKHKQKPSVDELSVEKDKEHIFNANHANMLLRKMEKI